MYRTKSIASMVDDNEINNILTSSPEDVTMELLRKCTWTACYKGNLNTMKLLIDRGCNIHFANSCGITPLMASTSFGYTEEKERLKLVKFLVQQGADINEEDFEEKTALHHAVESGYVNISTWLSTLYDRDVLSNVFLAQVKKNNVLAAEQMLQRGANIEYSGMNGVRALIIATCRGCLPMLSMLVYKGVDLQTRIRSRATVLHFAARKEKDILQFFLQRNLDLNAITAQKNTALHYATEECRVDNVLLLLQHGSDVNAENETGETPLLIACRRYNYDMIRTLLVHGASSNICDVNGNLPLNTIVLKPNFNSFELVDLLLEYGVFINGVVGPHVLPLLCSNNPKVSFHLIRGLIERGCYLPAVSWFCFVKYDPTLLKLAVWAMGSKRMAVAYFFTFVYGEEKGVRPVPVPRRLTGAAGLYPIRRRLAAYMVYRRASERFMIQEIVDQF